MTRPKIIYTETDEAPALATFSLLPIIEAFAEPAGIAIETRDISLAGRIIAQFSDRLTPEQRQADDLAELGKLAKTPEANIIKLPNISASIPQLVAAIEELQGQSYDLPNYPAEPENDEQRDIHNRYSKVLGSAVNPVLREGNSDRRVAKPVKEYARQNPHRMGEWSAGSQTHVAHMSEGDFYASERSAVVANAGNLSIELETAAGESHVLKPETAVLEDELIDASVMSCQVLREYFEREIESAKDEGLLLSLHVKATMMKVSDPIIFGHAVSVYYRDVFDKYSELFEQLGVDANNGIGDVYAKLDEEDGVDGVNVVNPKLRAAVEADIAAVYEQRPPLAMVDSDNGITNLHVPSNVIIDASMPAAIRSSGKMWGPDGELHDTKALIPDRCYAGIYQAVIEDCKVNGAFDVPTMGNVSNVGLMAQKAEEYGSHDKTFEIEVDGTVRVRNESGDVLIEQSVAAGDIWRMCQTKDEPIRDWVRLAVERAQNTGDATMFWLDPARSHDRQLIEKVERYLGDHDTTGLDIRILSPADAMRATLERVRAGENSISVTGNVLRDYLTDLFPILELGTSAKMLSIVPLLAGGGLYETGAGGSAPKHVQQFLAENHLRWDSLGEFLALAVSIEDLARKTRNSKATVVAAALDSANSKWLTENRAPSRKAGELDNRGSHFYLALYWAEALARQSEDSELASRFAPFAQALAMHEQQIVAELNEVQGQPIDIGGYYRPARERVAHAMRPSATFNALLSSLSQGVK